MGTTQSSIARIEGGDSAPRRSAGTPRMRGAARGLVYLRWCRWSSAWRLREAFTVAVAARLVFELVMRVRQRMRATGEYL